MRYIIDTNDGNVGKQLTKWEKQKNISIIEKGFPVKEIKLDLEKVGRALETLRRVGISNELMEMYISKKTGIGITQVRAMLYSQKDFFKIIGVKL